MRSVDPRQIYDYLQELFTTGKYDRLLAERFFQGIVTSVTTPTLGIFLVRIRRTGESSSDQNDYLCVTPGYTPRAGDVVECFWRDLNFGYVFAPTTPIGIPTLSTSITMTIPLALVGGSTDLAGRVTFTATPALAQGGVVATVTFSKPWPITPRAIVVNDTRGFGNVLQAYSPAAASFGVVVGFGGIPAGQSEQFDYSVQF